VGAAAELTEASGTGFGGGIAAAGGVGATGLTTGAAGEEVDALIGGVGRGSGPQWDERIFEPQVVVDDNIAHVWTYYEFWRGTELSHCGYDSVFLVKLAYWLNY